MALGQEFHAQRTAKTVPLIAAFQLVIDQIAAGNVMTDFLGILNPFEKYRRMKAEQCLFHQAGLICRALYNEIASIVRSRKQSAKIANETANHRTIIDLALQDEEYGSEATLTEVVDQIKTFMFAGHDTTASMISWAYYYLSYHPEYLAKIKAEHDEVFGPDTEPAIVGQKIKSNPSILNKLEYTLAVLKESLRLRPIGDGVRYAPPGYIIRTATGAEFDTTGMIMNLQHDGLHTSEEIWGPTAKDFNPERFIGGKRIPMAYMPFAARPRDCIGKNLAYLEAPS